jgi:hypothetical protein
MFQDEYMSRDAGAMFMGIILLYFPAYLWGTHINREAEI